MTVQLYYTGTVGPLYYDDAEDILDPDTGLPSGAKFEAVQTTGQMSALGAPIEKPNVIRLEDLLGVSGLLVDFAFNMSVVGFSDVATVACKAHRIGRLVGLYIPTIQGTSNSTIFQLTGIPANIIPTSTSAVLAIGQNADAYGAVTVYLTKSSNTIRLFAGIGSPFAASGVKSIVDFALFYILL